jgi:uncharacterized repeat protein (TIGR03803 family)
MATLQLSELSALIRGQGDQRASVIKLSGAKRTGIAMLLSAAVCTWAATQSLRTPLSFEGANGNQPFAQNEQALAKSAKFNTLVNFDGTNGGNPAGSLIQGRDGKLYGTTFDGGSNNNKICLGGGCGTVFKISARGTLTTLYNFCAETNCADGANPAAPLVLGKDGNIYGITELGGATGSGTVFKITPSGSLTTLYNWCSQPGCADGAYVNLPETGSFVQATDGNFYGTNDTGGTALVGTVFKLTPSGTLTTLYSFCSQTACADGVYPTGLIQATNGNFYGTTQFGGANRYGTVFKITPGGKLTTLYSFCSQTNCTDGSVPFGPLVQANDGNFYGTTEAGGTSTNTLCGGFCGTAFKMTTSGTLTTLYNFCSLANCADGASPSFSLVQGTDGNFYGSTLGGNGVSQFGITVFRLNSGGNLTTLHTFDTVSQGPDALFQATTGAFYGVTLEGGTSNNCSPFTCGIAFSLAAGLAPFVETVPTAGKVGSQVAILGQGLKGTTAVSFKGTAAKFTVHSDTYLTATVPKGAATGFVTVTTSKRKLRSNQKFRVIP